MRILFLSNLYPPNVVGGYERLCYEVAAGLSARGHEIAVLTSDYGGRVAEYPGQQVERCWTLPVGSRAIYEPYDGAPQDRKKIAERNVRCLEQQIARCRPTVLFVWNLFFLDASLLTAIRRQTVPAVFLLTDNWLIATLNPRFWQRYFQKEVLGVRRSRSRSLCEWVASCVRPLKAQRFRFEDRAIFASRYMESLYERAGLRFSDSTVIHHGVSQADPVPYAPRELLRDPGTLRLLFAGRVVEIKGVHTAIDAIPHIIEGLPELQVRLAIVGDAGDPGYLKRLRERIDQLRLADHVEFQPAVPEAELPQLFARHDVYVFPSLYEPFSLTLIHALRVGIPTIASDAGGNVEIVLDGVTGRVFRRGDARALAGRVIELARDGSARAALARAGREVATQFTFTRMLDGIERYLEASR